MLDVYGKDETDDSLRLRRRNYGNCGPIENGSPGGPRTMGQGE
jgi:hypothetical protein